MFLTIIVLGSDSSPLRTYNITSTKDLVDFTTSGVWFSISLPEDSCINVSTKGSELDTILALYEGDCSNLTCITGTDDSDPDLSTEILFRAQANQQYRMLVGNAAFAGQGNFTVNVTVSISFNYLSSNGTTGVY